jgi:hypothetical protein
MTDKQRNFLLKYISEELIKNKSDFRDFSFVTSCIGFIMKTENRGFPIFNIMVKKENPNECLSNQIRSLKDHINANVQCYSGPNDEGYSFKYAYFIPESDRSYFVFEQSWCKGMSDSVTRHYITVNENGDEIKYNTQYEELFRLNINTLHLFFEYLKRNSF